MTSFRFPLVVFFVVFISCTSSESGEQFERRQITIESGGRNIYIDAELALTSAQHQQGLMFREYLNDGEGMLFVFDRDQILSFWMKNTLIPLSIAYIASDGRIIEIHDMTPGNLNPVRSTRSVRYALEVPQNWFARTGIVPGDRLDVQGGFR